MTSWSKEKLEELYQTMSIGEIASHLNVPKSTIYYHIRKNKIECRNKSDAQKKKSKESHPRKGKAHSVESKNAISDKLKEYWDSEDGVKAKKSISKKRKRVWIDLTPRERKSIINKMSSAPRAKKGEMSNFTRTLFEFFIGEGESVSYNVYLTQDDLLDIVFEDRKVAIKIQAIMSSAKMPEIEDVPKSISGYFILPYRSKCTSISRAECQRIYELVKNISVS